MSVVDEQLAALFDRVGELEQHAAHRQTVKAIEGRVVELENALPEDQVAGNLEFLNNKGEAESLAAGPEGKPGKEGPAGPEGKEGKAGASAKMGKPGAVVAGPAALEELEPSAEKDAIVTLSLNLEGNPSIVGIFVDGVEIESAFKEFAGSIRISFTFCVPAKSKWKWKAEAGASSAHTHSYTFFG